MVRVQAKFSHVNVAYRENYRTFKSDVKKNLEKQADKRDVKKYMNTEKIEEEPLNKPIREA